MRIVSWNVNGIRAVLKKGFLDYLDREAPDVLCLQETKAQPEQVPEVLHKHPEYRAFWNSGNRPGYAGVATLTRVPPVRTEYGFGVDPFDEEGRTIMTEFENFILFNIYFPNGQKDETRLRYKMDFYERFLETCRALRRKGKSLVVCGDFNTAHKEIDLTHPRANEGRSGFLPEERAWMDRWVEAGFVDTFRKFNPAPGQYTWWSYRMNARSKNVGWRIDYHFVSSDLVPRVRKSTIRNDVYGSDHCPILLEISA